MRDRPAGFGERELTHALAVGWHIHAASAEYAPVGGGSYHWVVRDHAGRHWFATVDDLDAKFWLGDTRASAWTGLRAAMDTAVALRRDAGLHFVLAPVPAIDGAAVQPFGAKHAVTLFPFVRGSTGRFGAALSPDVRRQLVEMLAALHTSTPAVGQPPTHQVVVPRGGMLETALGELDRPWRGGPYSEPARALITAAAGHIRRLLDRFGRLAGEVAVAAHELVVTHGEPHNANLLWTRDSVLMIDWDTVGLALPERDLWMVGGEGGEEARYYTAITGRPVDAAALTLYRIRWQLDDIAAFVHMFRSRHGRTRDAEHTWHGLSKTLAQTRSGNT